MWIVRIALQRPYTFIVLALLIVLLGVFSILRTATDIFPQINIPVVATIWRYAGLPPEDMSNRLVLGAARAAQTVVNNVEHTEALSVNGTAVIKYFFRPGVDEALSYSQIASLAQTQINSAPAGISPPYVLAYNASTVPILQFALSSDTLSESRIFDMSNNLMRTALATVAGASLPFPFGGRQRQVQVDLDPQALRANGLSASDVTSAIAAQNLALPAGTLKLGALDYFVRLNASVRQIDELNALPIRSGNGRLIQLRDLGYVHDGASVQSNIVRLNGHRAILMTVLKTGNASTLDIVDEIRKRMPQIRQMLPPELKIETVGDQSLFVRAAVSSVVHEAVIAAALTGLMILLFLGSWRSTLIITISIPLSILASIICLSLLGETINIMTLGGLALAVGILVDDATVTIENINWHLEQGKDVQTAIMDGARQIAQPALVSTLAICIVFAPMFLLSGIARYLFVPMAEAVIFAMLASYLLSRTLVPTLAQYWLRVHAHVAGQGAAVRLQAAFERQFAKLREHYHGWLQAALQAGPRFIAIFLLLVSATALLAFPIGRYLPGLGQDFFPSVDAGQIKLHLRAPSGLRIEETAALCDRVEAQIRQLIPARDLDTVVDNIGLPFSGINLTYSTSAPIGNGDADILISLRKGHRASAEYVELLRQQLPQSFPEVSFAFLPADIVSQILNFGLPSAIDVQVSGFRIAENRAYAQRLLAQLRAIPGAVDLRIQQAADYPQLNVNVDRHKAMALGLTQQNVASNMLISLSGSFQTSPSFWVDPNNGTQYAVAVQTPQPKLHSLSDLSGTALTRSAGSAPATLADVASFGRSVGPAVVNLYDAQPAIDIYGAVQGMDLGYVASRIRAVLAETQDELPKGSKVTLRGQAQTMQDSFNGLLLGLAGAIVLVYLLIVVNFQSWLDPLIIIGALPAALAGIVWMLFLTHTTVSVPALTGAIMCMGVATANSVLVVSFARERLLAGDTALQAALAAGTTRFRPVLMTALAMIIGMVPMAMGLGDGGEQNAPLGRAVIGGLFAATIATLLFVPCLFAQLHGRDRAAPFVARENH